MVTETSDTKVKTQKSCYSMFIKWQSSLDKTESKGKNSVAHYVHACIHGYPKGTTINPSLLKTRVNGIKAHAETNNLAVTDMEVKKAMELIEKYKESKRAKDFKNERTF